MPKETILILDKEYGAQWVLKTLLESEKYIVITVDTIDRAVQNFLEFEVSGFITEYSIDPGCILEKIRELKKEFPEAYVMMMTDKDVSESAYEKIINAGVDDFFIKPLSIKKILLHLRKGLRQRHISLQKKRLELELNHLKEEKPFGDVVAGRGNLAMGK
jgi:DNA-binding response OmpR family regulator